MGQSDPEENGRRRIVILANSDGKTDMAEIVRRIRAELDAASLPQGVTASEGIPGPGGSQPQDRYPFSHFSRADLRNSLQPLPLRRAGPIIMGGVPLALIGSVAALALTGQPLSVASMVGFITLAGIATRNGILKISHYINLALRERMEFGQDLSSAEASSA